MPHWSHKRKCHITIRLVIAVVFFSVVARTNSWQTWVAHWELELLWRVTVTVLVLSDFANYAASLTKILIHVLISLPCVECEQARPKIKVGIVFSMGMACQSWTKKTGLIGVSQGYFKQSKVDKNGNEHATLLHYTLFPHMTRHHKKKPRVKSVGLPPLNSMCAGIFHIHLSGSVFMQTSQMHKLKVSYFTVGKCGETAR